VLTGPGTWDAASYWDGVEPNYKGGSVYMLSASSPGAAKPLLLRFGSWNRCPGKAMYVYKVVPIGELVQVEDHGLWTEWTCNSAVVQCCIFDASGDQLLDE